MENTAIKNPTALSLLVSVHPSCDTVAVCNFSAFTGGVMI
jgi:hypothetical protein